MSGVVLLGADEAAVLAHHADRLRRWDPGTAVRLVSRGAAIGVFACPPIGCTTLLTIPVADGTGLAGLDRSLSASSLATALTAARAAGAAQVSLRVPAPGRGEPWLAALPPEDGWHLPVPGVSGDLVPLADAAVEELRDRARGLPSDDAAAIADEIWSRTAWAGLPMRVLHAARRLGFLGQDASRVAAATAGDWKRLTTVRGLVFVRLDGIPGLLRLVT